jgi:hypothetical protein
MTETMPVERPQSRLKRRCSVLEGAYVTGKPGGDHRDTGYWGSGGGGAWGPKCFGYRAAVLLLTKLPDFQSPFPICWLRSGTDLEACTCTTLRTEKLRRLHVWSFETASGTDDRI